MQCAEVQPLLAGFWRGELSGSEAQQVERHLGHCTACQQELEQTASLSSSLSTLLGETLASTHVPARATRRWQHALESVPAPPAKGTLVRRWMVPAVVGCTAAVLALVLVLPWLGLVAPVIRNPASAQAPGAKTSGMVSRIERSVTAPGLQLQVHSLYGDQSQTVLLMELHSDSNDVTSAGTGASSLELSDPWGQQYQPQDIVWRPLQNQNGLYGLARFRPLTKQPSYLVIHIHQVAGHYLPLDIKAPLTKVPASGSY